MLYRDHYKRNLLHSILLSFGLFSALGNPVMAEGDETLIKVNDLHFGETLYHFFQKKYFSAITDLLVAQEKHPIKTQGHYPDLLLGGLYLSYNMSQPAGDIFNRLAEQKLDRSIRNSAWYYLAQIEYDARNLEQAQQAIEKVGTDLPRRYNDEFQHLRSNVLLMQHKYKEAVQVLKNFSGSTEWASYAKFNLAIALIMSDEQKQGMKLLEEVAAMDVSDVEQLALRDKANLALGYSALRNRLYDKAPAYFKKISLASSQSNKALLGIGWAHHKKGNLTQSLVPWVELRKRATKDLAVQEALLTIPYALEGLNAKQQALDYYNEAINTYNNELSSINQVVNAVKSGEFINALRNLHLSQQKESHSSLPVLPDSIATSYLQGLLAEHNFQKILRSYRNLLYMKNILAHWDAQIPAYQMMLSERQQAYQAKLPLINSFYQSGRENKLRERYKTLKQKFNNINNNTDVLALANEQELNLLQRLDKIKKTLDKLPAEGAIKQREQYRLFKGMVYWQIAEQYSARHWQIKKQLQEIEQVFNNLESRKKSALQQLQETPQQFAEFATRIRDKQFRVLGLSNRIDTAIASQEVQINSLALENLQHQKNQIENYHIRASYSLTRLYDSVAALEDEQ